MPETTPPTAIRLIGPLLLVWLVGCAGQVNPPTPSTAATPAPPTAAPSTTGAKSFDLALVKSEFNDRCADSRLDESFCEKVYIDGWKARGMTLVVPTGFRGADRDTARTLCLVIQRERYEDPQGTRLGFRVIEVLNMYGVESYSCWEPRF